MSQQLPIVFETDPRDLVNPTTPIFQKLQPGNDLDIPLQDRVENLEYKLTTLITWLAIQGFEIPEEIL
jgi:hypothetical protein